WVWQTQFLSGDLGRAIEVFADVVKNPSFPDAEVKAMKERVLAAIANQDQDWRAAGNRQFRKAFFGPGNSPYQFTVVGTKENVEGFSPQDLKQWYGEKVLKGRRVLAIYGDSDASGAQLLVEQQFSHARGIDPSPSKGKFLDLFRA